MVSQHIPTSGYRKNTTLQTYLLRKIYKAIQLDETNLNARENG